MTNGSRNADLKLENQLCFPLYACSKEIIRRYKPYLDELNLTYTQYLTMMILWEKKNQTVKDLGIALLLDSGTLTPVLKKLENKGYLIRRRSTEDERSLIVTITEEGDALKEKALDIPAQIADTLKLDSEEKVQLSAILTKILNTLEDCE